MTDRATALAERLEGARARTLELLAPLSDEALVHQPGPQMGVVAWDVGHIGAFEEIWLVDNLQEGRRDLSALAEAFDPIAHPRSERGEMQLPSRRELLAYLATVRKQALELLEPERLDPQDPLTRDGFVYDMIVRHEHQHQENMIITLQMMEPDGPVGAYRPSQRQAKPEAQVTVEGMAKVPSGTYEIGTDRHVGAYDNENPAHPVALDAFAIAKAPVTNGNYLAFIEDGGYQQEGWWSTDGWLIKEALGYDHPRTWHRQEGTWYLREMDRLLQLPPDQPVCHVSYYEAEAYAAWAGGRLPTEEEWEVGATWDPETGGKRWFPWGDDPWTPEKANLRHNLWGPAPVGAYPGGASALGCHQMTGDVWEWTSTVFSGYPGFDAFPYPEYSQDHFDAGYQVLRGGSWATWPACAHGTFRNWHQPDHQQPMAGFRIAEDL